MFYVVFTISTRTLHYNQEDATKALKARPGSSVQTFRTRAEAINFINKPSLDLSKPITIVDSHVLYVEIRTNDTCVNYTGRILAKDGQTYTFSGSTPVGVTNDAVAEMMAYRTVLDAYPTDRIYFVSTSSKIVETYLQHRTSATSSGADPITQMCLDTLDMMVRRNVIVSMVDPIIQA